MPNSFFNAVPLFGPTPFKYSIGVKKDPTLGRLIIFCKLGHN